MTSLARSSDHGRASERIGIAARRADRRARWLGVALGVLRDRMADEDTLHRVRMRHNDWWLRASRLDRARRRSLASSSGCEVAS